MRKLALWLIRFYQKFISFDTGWGKFLAPSSACRFFPPCSEYTYQAIAKYGILHGSIVGLKRILRCHPGSAGGLDPVP
jgi:uncharacterized protein